MNFLIIDTSSDCLTIAIKSNDKLFSYKSEESRKSHSVNLLPEINQLLKEANLELSNMDYFGCVVGPGSFTGVRIGVATVNAFGYAFNKPVIGVTAFEPFAYNSKADTTFAIDAKHGNYFTAKKVGNSLEYHTYEGEILPEGVQFIDVNSITAKSLACVMENKIKCGEQKVCVAPFYMRASEAERNLKK